MPKYYSAASKKIVEYPAEAAALFADLKPVPSERHKATTAHAVEPVTVAIPKKDEKDAK